MRSRLPTATTRTWSAVGGGVAVLPGGVPVSLPPRSSRDRSAKPSAASAGALVPSEKTGGSVTLGDRPRRLRRTRGLVRLSRGTEPLCSAVADCSDAAGKQSRTVWTIADCTATRIGDASATLMLLTATLCSTLSSADRISPPEARGNLPLKEADDVITCWSGTPGGTTCNVPSGRYIITRDIHTSDAFKIYRNQLQTTTAISSATPERNQLNRKQSTILTVDCDCRRRMTKYYDGWPQHGTIVKTQPFENVRAKAIHEHHNKPTITQFYPETSKRKLAMMRFYAVTSR
eukprot:m.1586139 g.1586139  ORF g.1586139 m.1586139 type:complete len:289 (-) comp25327_c0_seq14:536-1402(-)